MTSKVQPPTVTLKERLAALQQLKENTALSTNSSLPASNSNTSQHGALRDKIAQFEQKGGVPVPRGSFGMGAPPVAENSQAKRSGELYGNRVSGLSRPSGLPLPRTRSGSPLPRSSGLRKLSLTAANYDRSPSPSSCSSPPSPARSDVTQDEAVCQPPSLSPSPHKNLFATALETTRKMEESAFASGIGLPYIGKGFGNSAVSSPRSPSRESSMGENYGYGEEQARMGDMPSAIVDAIGYAMEPETVSSQYGSSSSPSQADIAQWPHSEPSATSTSSGAAEQVSAPSDQEIRLFISRPSLEEEPEEIFEVDHVSPVLANLIETPEAQDDIDAEISSLHASNSPSQSSSNSPVVIIGERAQSPLSEPGTTPRTPSSPNITSLISADEERPPSPAIEPQPISVIPSKVELEIESSSTLASPTASDINEEDVPTRGADANNFANDADASTTVMPAQVETTVDMPPSPSSLGSYTPSPSYTEEPEPLIPSTQSVGGARLSAEAQENDRGLDSASSSQTTHETADSPQPFDIEEHSDESRPKSLATLPSLVIPPSDQTTFSGSSGTRHLSISGDASATTSSLASPKRAVSMFEFSESQVYTPVISHGVPLPKSPASRSQSGAQGTSSLETPIYDPSKEFGAPISFKAVVHQKVTEVPAVCSNRSSYLHAPPTTLRRGAKSESMLRAPTSGELATLLRDAAMLERTLEAGHIPSEELDVVKESRPRQSSVPSERISSGARARSASRTNRPLPPTPTQSVSTTPRYLDSLRRLKVNTANVVRALPGAGSRISAATTMSVSSRASSDDHTAADDHSSIASSGETSPHKRKAQGRGISFTDKLFHRDRAKSTASVPDARAAVLAVAEGHLTAIPPTFVSRNKPSPALLPSFTPSVPFTSTSNWPPTPLRLSNNAEPHPSQNYRPLSSVDRPLPNRPVSTVSSQSSVGSSTLFEKEMYDAFPSLPERVSSLSNRPARSLAQSGSSLMSRMSAI